MPPGDDVTTTTAPPASPTRAREPEAPAGSRLRFALILGGLTAFGALSIDMYLPALPALTGELGTTSAQAQLTLTAVLLGLAFGQLIAGPISDAVGRRGPLLVGVTLYVVMSLLCAVAASVEVLTVLRLVQGLSAAVGMVIARAAVRDLYSGADATRFFSSLMLVTGLAPILAPVIGGVVLQYTTWRGVFVVLAAFGALLLVVVTFALPETKPQQWRQPLRWSATARTFWMLVRDRPFLGNALGNGLGIAAMFAYVSGSSYVLQGVYGMSPQTFAWTFAVNSIGLVAGGQINGRLVGRVATEQQLLLGAFSVATVAGAVLVTTVAAGLPLQVVLAAMFALISSLGFVLPNTAMLALAEHREVSGSASALLGAFQFVTGALAAPLVGLGGVSSALPMVLVMFGVTLTAAVVWFTIGRRRAEPAPVTLASHRA